MADSPAHCAARVGAGRAVEPASSRAAPDLLTVRSPERVVAGQEFAVDLALEGGGRTQALSAVLRWEAGVVEPLGVEPGDWLARLGASRSRRGRGRWMSRCSGRAHPGSPARAWWRPRRFRALASGEPRVGLSGLTGRDAANREVPFTTSVVNPVVPRPTSTELTGAYPNPFRGSTSIAFSLADAGHVSVSICGVDGRLVRTLADGPREPDLYRLEWDGRNDAGQVVAAGVYLVQLTTSRGRSTRRVAFLR